VVLPFWYMVITSLKPQSYIFEIPPRLWPQEVTLSNYTTALGKDLFGLYFLNSLIVAVSSTALTVLVSGLLAYAFARFEFPGREALFYVFLLGMMIPPVMLIIPQFIIAKALHLLDKLPGLVVVYVTMNLSMQTFLLRGFFEGLPRDLEEAALIDGAGRWTIFLRIVLPLSRPGIAVVTIFTFLYSWESSLGRTWLSRRLRGVHCPSPLPCSRVSISQSGARSLPPQSSPSSRSCWSSFCSSATSFVASRPRASKDDADAPDRFFSFMRRVCA